MSACAKFEFPSLSRSGLKVSGSVGVGWGGFQVTTVSNLNPSCIELESGLGFDNNLNPSCIEVEFGLGFDNIESLFSCRFCTEMDMTRHALYSCEC